MSHPLYSVVSTTYKVQAKLDPGWNIGSLAKGTPLTVVPMVEGTVKSEPGFEPAIDAKLFVLMNLFRGRETNGGVDMVLDMTILGRMLKEVI